MNEKTVYIMDAEWRSLPAMHDEEMRHLADARSYCRRVERKRSVDRAILTLLGVSAGLFAWACVLALLVG